MRLLVFGSRGWGVIPDNLSPADPEWQAAKERAAIEQDVISAALAGFYMEATVLIHGAAHGADLLAAEYCEGWNEMNRDTGSWASPVEIIPFPADWRKYGNAAGPMRNARMITEGKPDMAIGFVNKPLHLSKGSADMARRARKAGVPTFVMERYDGPS